MIKNSVVTEQLSQHIFGSRRDTEEVYYLHDRYQRLGNGKETLGSFRKKLLPDATHAPHHVSNTCNLKPSEPMIDVLSHVTTVEKMMKAALKSLKVPPSLLILKIPGIFDVSPCNT